MCLFRWRKQGHGTVGVEYAECACMQRMIMFFPCDIDNSVYPVSCIKNQKKTETQKKNRQKDKQPSKPSPPKRKEEETPLTGCPSKATQTP
jgi:hypothetical protein